MNFEIIDNTNGKLYQSESATIIRCNGGVLINFLKAQKKGKYIVEVVQAYLDHQEQLHVAKFDTNDGAVNFILSYRQIMPNLTKNAELELRSEQWGTFNLYGIPEGQYKFSLPNLVTKENSTISDCTCNNAPNTETEGEEQQSVAKDWREGIFRDKIESLLDVMVAYTSLNTFGARSGRAYIKCETPEELKELMDTFEAGVPSSTQSTMFSDFGKFEK